MHLIQCSFFSDKKHHWHVDIEYVGKQDRVEHFRNLQIIP